MSKNPFPSFPRLTIFAGAVDRCRCISSMPAVSFPLTVLALEEMLDGTWLTESSGVTLLIIPARSDGWSDGWSDGFSERARGSLLDWSDGFSERARFELYEDFCDSPPVGAWDFWRAMEGRVSKEDRRDSMDPPFNGGFMEGLADRSDNSWLTIEGFTFPLLDEA